MVALERRLTARAAALPGVKSAAACTVLPIGNHGGSTTFHVVGRPEHGERIEVISRTVDENYFPAIGARLIRGRNFAALDDATHPPVVIINRSMATVHFPGEDPIGKQIRYDATSPPMLIIGIVDDIQEGPLDVVNGPSFYTPFAQGDDHRFFLVARASVDEHALLASLTAAVREADPRLLTSQPTVMTERIHDSPAAYLHRSAAWLVGSFAALALLLGIVGLYGVIAYSVSRRTREIGVRMALGAQRATVCSLILREAAWLTFIGIACGLAASIAAATLMRKLLFGIEPWDAPTLAIVAIVLAASAMLASYIPASRAASVNPVDALRSE
jgi:macrolide transport system ATP-binding/permease protein